jgi:hypothetical protein
VERSQFGTMEPDVFFQGEVLAKVGPGRYQITKGSFTTCVPTHAPLGNHRLERHG